MFGTLLEQREVKLPVHEHVWNGRVLNLPPGKGQDEEPAAFCASLPAACSTMELEKHASVFQLHAVRCVQLEPRTRAKSREELVVPDKPSSRRKAQLRVNSASAPDRNDW